MGYLVPENKKKINEVVDQEFSSMIENPAVADALKDLAHAYHEAPDAFNKRADEYFDTMASLFQEFNIKQEKEEESVFFDPQKVFPQEQRTQENFKETFHKLWKSVAISAEFKKSVIESINSLADIAQNYENYSPAYDRILMTRDMRDNINRYFGQQQLDPKLHATLRNLYLLNAEHYPDKPFSEHDINNIRLSAMELNKGFAKYNDKNECIDPGLFAPGSVKTPADLEKYLDNYETMLRDRVKNNAKDFYIFAQGYELDNSNGDTIERLNEEDLKDLDRKVEALEFQEKWKADYQADRTARQQKLSDELNPLFQNLNTYLNGLNELKDRESVNAYSHEVLGSFNEELNKANPDVTADPEVKEAQAAYDQAMEAVRNDLEKLHPEYQRKNRPKDILFTAADENQFSGLHSEYKSLLKYSKDTLASKFKDVKIGDFDETTEEKRAEAKAKTDAARDAFKTTIKKQIYTDIVPYSKEVQEKVDAITKAREELKKDPYQPEYENKKTALTTAIKDLRNDLYNHLDTYKKERADAEKTLQKAIKPYQDEIKPCYDAEKANRINCLKNDTPILVNIQAEMKEKYDKTRVGRGVAKKNDEKHQDLSNKLKDICEAMNSVKKAGIFSNTQKYNDMVNAIKAYSEKKINANQALEACQAYLKQSLNADGTLKNMSSKAGKIRKQACVRMMELLETAPDRSKTSEKKDAVESAPDKKDNANKKEVPKDKIDYATLKASLATKSDAVTVNKNSKDAKAYSNLNAKLSEMKEARKAAAEANEAGAKAPKTAKATEKSTKAPKVAKNTKTNAKAPKVPEKTMKNAGLSK